ncbi:concanavalin A-like lectin/glucanase domain-containing protein [Dichotomocladium elegans]|nr:concanavalin A-like lectin/glucanase domain-containing protein [Dichotomocladium elegans]
MLGQKALKDGGQLNLWSGEPSVSCTDNSNYGCERTSGAAAGGNYINPIQSARLRTIDSVSIRYGKVEVRARLPVGDWLWPAIWMMPKHSAYGVWPASGEIDIMESRGNRDYPYGNITTFGSTLHWGTHYTMDQWDLSHAEAILENGSTFADDFHTYGKKIGWCVILKNDCLYILTYLGMEWSEEGLRTYVDDITILLVNFDQSFWDRGGFPETMMNPWRGSHISAPFDQEFYLILNVAAGGATEYWPDAPGKPWKNSDPHAMNSFWDHRDQWLETWGEGNKRALAVDWVKIWSADKEC